MKNKIVITYLFIMFALVKNANAELNASNYQTYEPDFVFDTYDEFANISKNHEKPGQNRKIEQTYLGKIIKTPFNAMSYDNLKNGIILQDKALDYKTLETLERYKLIMRVNTCLIGDDDNTDKFVGMLQDKWVQVEVIGRVAKINPFGTDLFTSENLGFGTVLAPCFVIKKIRPL